jgi:hypothetical protein
MQIFHNGDHVRIADDLGPTMSHFTSGVEAIVIGSYADQYGGSNTKSYTLHIKGKGRTSWYEEHQLKLIERNRADMLRRWKEEEDEKSRREADLGWIFSNGASVMKAPSGSTIAALARHMGIANLWGSAGEGITYYQMSLAVLELARPFLWYCDEEGFLEFAHDLRDTVRWPYGCGAHIS